MNTNSRGAIAAPYPSDGRAPRQPPVPPRGAVRLDTGSTTPCPTRANAARSLRDRLGGNTEERLGRALSELLENPLLTGAIGRAFDAREKAAQAQEVAMGALNLPSAADIERLTRRLRSVSQRLEGDRGRRRPSGPHAPAERRRGPPSSRRAWPRSRPARRLLGKLDLLLSAASAGRAKLAGTTRLGQAEAAAEPRKAERETAPAKPKRRGRAQSRAESAPPRRASRPKAGQAELSRRRAPRRPRAPIRFGARQQRVLVDPLAAAARVEGVRHASTHADRHPGAANRARTAPRPPSRPPARRRLGRAGRRS